MVIYDSTGKEINPDDIDYSKGRLEQAEDGRMVYYTWAEKPVIEDAEEMRVAKHAELSAACSQAIMAGVDVELSGGTQHFSLTEKDQLNLFGKQAQLASGLTQLEYHEDGKPCVFYSAADMQLIIQAAMKWVTYHTTYCNSLFTWLRACSTASDMAQIEYGSAIPLEYQSEVYKAYINE